MNLRALLLITMFVALAGQSHGEDWPYWRGANGTGIASKQASAPPVEWSEEDNVVWKVELPGRGHGSPTVVGDKIYLATADEEAGTQFVMALERETVRAAVANSDLRNRAVACHPSEEYPCQYYVACEGDRLFATFYSDGKIRVAALTTAGEVMWKKDVADFDQKYPFGYAASPLPRKDTVIVAAESEAETVLVAYDQVSGEEKWRTDRPQNSSYSSPVILNVAGRDQLLMNGGKEVRAYDPDTGEELWDIEGSAKHTAGTVTADGNLVVASGGYPQSETCCIDATKREVIWRNKQKCYEQSMIIAGGYVYALNDQGIAFCWDAKTGEEQWKNDWVARSALRRYSSVTGSMRAMS